MQVRSPEFGAQIAPGLSRGGQKPENPGFQKNLVPLASTLLSSISLHRVSRKDRFSGIFERKGSIFLHTYSP